MRVLNIGLDNTYASILLESLIRALDELKNSTDPWVNAFFNA